MALQFIDKSQMVSWIIDAWQNELDTEMDPADGKWFTNGPGNSRVGLFGGLSDRLADELIFEETSKIFTPHQKSVDTAIVDNRNGLNPKSTVTLTYKYSDITTSTHGTSKAVKSGISEAIKVSASFSGIGVESTTTFSFDFTYSWSESNCKQKGEEHSFSQSVDVKPPEGKVYQVLLMCNIDHLTVPYRALVRIMGKSEANFPGPVRGKKHWEIDAGTLCAWINKHGSAGDQSRRLGANPDEPGEGFFALEGTMTGTNTTNFTAVVKDITDSFTGDEDAGDAEGVLVAVTPFSSAQS